MRSFRALLLALLAANAGRTVPTVLLEERAALTRVRQHVSRRRRKLDLPAAEIPGPSSVTTTTPDCTSRLTSVHSGLCPHANISASNS